MRIPFPQVFTALAVAAGAAMLVAGAYSDTQTAPQPYWRLGNISIYRAVDSQTEVACYVLSGPGGGPQLACSNYRMRAGAVGDPNEVDEPSSR